MTDLLLRSGRLLDPISGQATTGDLLLRNGSIADPASAGDEVETLDLAGATVVPGLIDAHFHAYAHCIGGLELETRATSYVAINATRRLRRALQRGFTTVRDVAGGDIGVRQALDEGIVPGPRYLYSGPALSQTGGHGDARPADFDHCLGPGHVGEVVDGVDNIRRVVRERLRTGAHVIKVMASGGVVSPTDPLTRPQYSAPEIAAACEEAGRRGSYVAAHAYTSEAVIHAVSNGVRSIEHGNLIDAEAAAVMAERGAFLVPTLVAYDAMARRADEVGLSEVGQEKNAAVLEHGLRAIALAQQAGVAVGFGSDLMGDLENDQLQGIALQAQAQDPLQLLRSLTVVNAELIGLPELASLHTGTPADLLVLSGDPLEDPSVLWDDRAVRTVIRAGRVVEGDRA